MGAVKGRPAVILLAEDDPADQKITKRALKEAKIHNDLHIVENGEEALDYLQRKGKYEDPALSPAPDLLLLDLNMPKLDGRQVLERIQKISDLHRIRIVVLTTSNQEADILKSYDLGVHSYITKPVDFDQFRHVVKTLGEYWFQIVVLPPHEED